MQAETFTRLLWKRLASPLKMASRSQEEHPSLHQRVILQRGRSATKPLTKRRKTTEPESSAKRRKSNDGTVSKNKLNNKAIKDAAEHAAEQTNEGEAGSTAQSKDEDWPWEKTVLRLLENTGPCFLRKHEAQEDAEG